MTAEPQIYWNKGDTVHLCEGFYVGAEGRSPFLVYTLCEIDVPANKGYRTDSLEDISNCPSCHEAQINAHD